MPWRETCSMEERMRFVLVAREEGAVMARICATFGISRDIGYKWLARYELEGVEGLKDRSRAPHHPGRSREAELVDDVLALHERYGWGPKKLRHKLGELRPEIVLPAASTIGDWLAKRGLTGKRKRRPRCPPHTQPFATADQPNAVWCVDFKGWFRTGDGARCDPLTMSDAMSRYLLCSQGVERADHGHVRPVFDAAFCEFGLPGAIRRCRCGGSSSASGRSGSSRPSRSRTAGMSACTERSKMRQPSRRRRPWSNSRNASMSSDASSTVSGRTKLWRSNIPPVSIDPRCGPIPVPCANPTTTTAVSFAASAPTARSSGRAIRSSSARCWSVNRSASTGPKRANGVSATPTSSSALSTAITDASTGGRPHKNRLGKGPISHDRLSVM